MLSSRPHGSDSFSTALKVHIVRRSASLFGKDNGNGVSEVRSNENSFAAKQIAPRKKVEGLHQRPFEKVEAAGIEPAAPLFRNRCNNR